MNLKTDATSTPAQLAKFDPETGREADPSLSGLEKKKSKTG